MSQRRVVRFHRDRQDQTAPGWRHLLDLIEEAAADGREIFRPFTELDAAERRQIITLPRSIAKLTAVRHLVLHRTNMVRLPAEIGAMASLETFEPHTSHRLHWYPYELTRCTRLAASTVSTRVLYGNFKLRSPFPPLRPVTTSADADFAALDPRIWGADAVRTCSVCDQPVTGEFRQVWISLAVATDVLPLLVNACSENCIAFLPAPQPGYIPAPHTGGPSIRQPPAQWQAAH